MFFDVVVCKSKKGYYYPALRFDNGRRCFIVSFDSSVICRVMEVSVDELLDLVDNHDEGYILKSFNVQN